MRKRCDSAQPPAGSRHFIHRHVTAGTAALVTIKPISNCRQPPRGVTPPRKCQKQGPKIQIKKQNKKETVASPHHPTTGLSSSVGRTNRRNYSSRDQNNRGLQAGQATEDAIPNSTKDSVSTAQPATTPTAASPPIDKSRKTTI